MGYYQKMKQAAKDVESYEDLHKRLTCPESKKWIYGKLESSRREYYVEKFSYYVSITLMVFATLCIFGILLVYFSKSI